MRIDTYTTIDISDDARDLTLRFKYNGSRTINIYQLDPWGHEKEIDIISYSEKPDTLEEIISDCRDWFNDQLTYEEIWRSA